MRLKSKQGHSNNNSKQQKEKRTPKIIALGLIKLDFYINITDEIIKRHSIDLSKINSPKDLTFLENDPCLLDLVQISTTDTLTNILLYLNKANTQKAFVELITLNPLRFRPEEEYMRKIFSHVTEHNYLFSNEMNVASTPNKISFAIKSGKKLLKYWDIVSDYDPFAEEIKKEGNLGKEGLRTEKNVIDEEEEPYAAGKSLKTNSDLNLSSKNKNNTKNNNYNDDNNKGNNSIMNNTDNKNFENFNNNENSRIKTSNNDPKGENSENNNEDYEKEDKEKMSNEAQEKAEQGVDEMEALDGSQEKQMENENEENAVIDAIKDNEDENLPYSEEANRDRSNLDFKVEDIQNQGGDNLSNNADLLYKVGKTEKNEPQGSQDSQNKQISNTNHNNNRTNTKENLAKNPSFSQQMNHSENQEISRTNRSMYKLFNIPAACEIEEYDFIFLNLEEFLNFHGSGLHLIELADFLKKIAAAAKTPRIAVSFPNILLNLHIMNLELIDIILTIMSYTDVFLFDKKECLAFFNMLSQMNNERELAEKNLFDHFQNQIKHVKSGVAKIGLFLDELQKFTVVEQMGERLICKNEHLLNLYPKINHTNQKVVEDYRKIMLLNSSYLRGIFFGGYFAKYLFQEDHYPAFISGIESTKRILELFKNKIDFPADPDFYVIKIQKEKIDKDLARKTLRKKEELFVLDCINKKTASIKHYNPLFDDNLNSFFAGEVIRKQLKEKGFINTNGFVLYDPSYKNISPPKNLKTRIDTAEKEKRLLYAIKNNKDIFSSDSESYSRSCKEASPTNRKLPLPTFTKDSSYLYFPDKLSKRNNAQKRVLKPLYPSVSKKEKEQKEEREREKSINSSVTKKNGSSLNTKNPKPKAKDNIVFPTQNYHTLNKSHLNSALNKSDLQDARLNNISNLENSIFVENSLMLPMNENADIEINSKKEIGNNNSDAVGEQNNNNDNDNIENKLGENEDNNNNADNAALKSENAGSNSGSVVERAGEENNEEDNDKNNENDIGTGSENAQQARENNEVKEEVVA